jgi:hypothetical protein
MSTWFITSTLFLQFFGGISATVEGKYAVAMICAAGVLAQVGALMMGRA